MIAAVLFLFSPRAYPFHPLTASGWNLQVPGSPPGGVSWQKCIAAYHTICSRCTWREGTALSPPPTRRPESISPANLSILANFPPSRLRQFSFFIISTLVPLRANIFQRPGQPTNRSVRSQRRRFFLLVAEHRVPERRNFLHALTPGWHITLCGSPRESSCFRKSTYIWKLRGASRSDRDGSPRPIGNCP